MGAKFGEAFRAALLGRAVSTYGVHYTYTSREWTPDAGLYYFRNRWYDAQLGRFSSRDPIGYVDGENLYSNYSSLSSTDPMGESVLWNCGAWSPWRAAGDAGCIGGGTGAACAARCFAKGHITGTLKPGTCKTKTRTCTWRLNCPLWTRVRTDVAWTGKCTCTTNNFTCKCPPPPLNCGPGNPLNATTSGRFPGQPCKCIYICRGGNPKFQNGKWQPAGGGNIDI
ncbi:RHS repeat-associated core domain-containing protein [Allorhodopirellula solitaria]|uniref:RHS repeat-associated core domain-containing protein n=1 Tax=Allorhodopirellula solitaria TaxID=2527987 RepID=UPI0011B4A123